MMLPANQVGPNLRRLWNWIPYCLVSTSQNAWACRAHLNTRITFWLLSRDFRFTLWPNLNLSLRWPLNKWRIFVTHERCAKLNSKGKHTLAPVLKICLATIALRIRHVVISPNEMAAWAIHVYCLLISGPVFNFNFSSLNKWAILSSVFPGVFHCVALRNKSRVLENVTVVLKYFCCLLFPFYCAVTADFSAETWQQRAAKVKAKFRFNCFCFSIGLSCAAEWAWHVRNEASMKCDAIKKENPIRRL